MNEFKTKISSLISTINTLDSHEKNEAFDYLKNFVSRFGNNFTSDTTSEAFDESSASKIAEQNGDEAILCPKCNRLFATKVELYEHLKEYTDDGPLSCKICRSVFNNFEVFTFHKREQFCQLELERLLKNRKKKYICECCKELFSNKKSYQLHTLQEHARKVKKANGGYICKLCNSSFRQKRLFFRHYRKSHCEDESVPEQNSDVRSCSAETVGSLAASDSGDCLNKKADNTDNSDLVQDKELKFQCAHCSKNFAKKNLLSNHLKFHFRQSGLICVTCKRTFLKYRYYKDHLKSLTHRNNLNDGGSEQHIVLFQCKTCNKTFANEDSLTHHTLRLHSATRKLMCCHLCDFKTTFPTNLKRHIRFHTSYRKFVCEECGSCFHTSSALKDHKIYLHTNERNYSCEKCGQTFKLRSGLNRHFKTHSDERNEKCDFCGQLFKLAANLRKHQLVVHGKTNGTNQKVQKFIRENDGYVINSPKMVKLRQRITSSSSSSSSSSTLKANNKIIETDKNIDDDLDIQPMSVLANVDLSYTDDVLQNVTSYNFCQFPVDGEDSSALLPERNITPIHVVEAVLQPSDSGIVHCLPHDAVSASCYSNDDQHLITTANEHHKAMPQYSQHQQYNSLPSSCGSSYFQQLFYVNRNVNHFVNANNPAYDVDF